MTVNISGISEDDLEDITIAAGDTYNALEELLWKLDDAKYSDTKFISEAKKFLAQVKPLCRFPTE